MERSLPTQGLFYRKCTKCTQKIAAVKLNELWRRCKDQSFGTAVNWFSDSASAGTRTSGTRQNQPLNLCLLPSRDWLLAAATPAAERSSGSLVWVWLPTIHFTQHKKKVMRVGQEAAGAQDDNHTWDSSNREAATLWHHTGKTLVKLRPPQEAQTHFLPPSRQSLSL